jgi:hypothetical protein
MKKLLLTTLLSIFYLFSFAQADVNNEIFKYQLSPNKTGAQIVYQGKSHYFTLNVTGKKVKPAPLSSARAENQDFIDIDNTILQTSLVALPKPLPADFKLSALTVEQQKTLLDGYVNYELDYLKDELHINFTALKKEYITLNSKLFVLWYFKMSPTSGSKNMERATVAQVYLSAVVFNQVLVVNVPVMDKDLSLAACIALVKKVGGNLALFNGKKRF